MHIERNLKILLIVDPLVIENIPMFNACLLEPRSKNKAIPS